MANTCTWVKLKNGVWGVRVLGPKPSLGDTLTVTRADGTPSEHTVSSFVLSKGEQHIILVAHPVVAPSLTARPSRRAGWRPCGHHGCRPGLCDDCDGEGGGRTYKYYGDTG